MTDYIAPLGDLNFVINELAGLEATQQVAGIRARNG